MVYHRVTGTASPDILLAPAWCAKKWDVLNGIADELARRDSRQGSRAGHAWREESNMPLDLVCPAGSLVSLKAAIDNGADAVYMGFRDNTNARAFPGLNFDEAQAAEGLRYAHDRGRKVLLALNTYPQPDSWSRWTGAVDRAAKLGMDAVILADAGLMRYAVKQHPQLRLHLSVQGSATSYEAVNFYREHFGIQRAVLPRVLSLAQVENVVKHTDVEIELFGFGGLCVMVEGRCLLSSYCTGESPNIGGRVLAGEGGAAGRTRRHGLESRLNGVLLDRYGNGRKGRLSDAVQGPLRSRRRNLLRHRGAHQPQHPRPAAARC